MVKKPGENIKRGEIIAVIETDKANVDVESFVDGVLEKILVEPGDEWLPVGTPLALIRVEGEVPSEPALAPPPAAAPIPVVPPPSIAAATPAAIAEEAMARLRISPAARKRALDLRSIPRDSSAPARRTDHAGGRRARRGGNAGAGSGRDARSRATHARRDRATMARSKREIPHYYLATTIDMASALAWLDERNRDGPVTERLIYGVLLIKATALALREVPELNGFWIDDRAQQSEAIHVGVAISLRGGGLVAPALHDADQRASTS